MKKNEDSVLLVLSSDECKKWSDCHFVFLKPQFNIRKIQKREIYLGNENVQMNKSIYLIFIHRKVFYNSINMLAVDINIISYDSDLLVILSNCL